ncbi:MAG: BON domain-containing protein [Polyangiaceae bacterium]
MSKTDMQLKEDIEAELLWDPKVNAAQIGVSVDKGAVTLTGAVDSFPIKWAAEDAVKRVAHVRSVAEELTVKILGEHKRTDTEIAQTALEALRWDVWVPKTVKASIRQGHVTLQGEVEWNYQREAAERAVRSLAGVTGISNSIHLKTNASSAQVKERVQAALQRQAMHDASSINVETVGGTVTLSGNASSWHAIEDAAHAAWAATGVTNVIDKVVMTGF